MKKFFFFLSILLCLQATAQVGKTNGRLKYANGKMYYTNGSGVTVALADSSSGFSIYGTKRTDYDSLFHVMNDSTGRVKAIRFVWPAGSVVNRNGTDSTLEIEIVSLPGGSSSYMSSNLRARRKLGSALVGESINAQLHQLANSYTMFDNTVCYVALDIPDTVTAAAGLKFVLTQAGVYTADQNNYVALFSLSGTTLTREAISANDGNLWKATANTMVSVPFTSTVDISPNKVYYAAFLYNNSAQTTNPNLAGNAFGSITALSFQDFTNSAVLHGRVSAQNTIPATQATTGITVSTDRIWVGIYK